MIRLSAPSNDIKVSIALGGSKSISNRLLVLKAVAGLEFSIQNLSTAEDTLLLQKALQDLKHQNSGSIDVHHAGTDLRFLTALLSITPGEWLLTGSERLRQRPIADLVIALKELGADIEYTEKENFPPLRIRGKKLAGGALSINSSVSSQFISALLLISPALENGLELTLQGETVSYPYIRMTLELLREFGAQIVEHNNIIRIVPASLQAPSPVYTVESDWSSASYWYSICALSGKAQIELHYLSEKSRQADAMLPALFDSLGVKTTFTKTGVLLTSKAVTATHFEHDFTSCPDIAQTLAATCFGLGISCHLSGLQTLKLKETDRIAALKAELQKFGAAVEVASASIRMAANQKKEQETVIIETYNDHRMAMSFAPLALLYKNLQIRDPQVVAKSYPAFWQDLKSAGFNVHLQP